MPLLFPIGVLLLFFTIGCATVYIWLSRRSGLPSRKRSHSAGHHCQLLLD